MKVEPFEKSDKFFVIIGGSPFVAALVKQIEIVDNLPQSYALVNEMAENVIELIEGIELVGGHIE